MTYLRYVAILIVLFASGAFAQATATQTLNLTVSPVYKISVSGNPGPLTVTDGTAGTANLSNAIDNTTTYSITQNVSNVVKITAGIDVVMPTGTTLTINLASTKGTSVGTVDISNALVSLDVVTGISRGADPTQTITYEFGASATAVNESFVRVVTLTITE